MSCRVFVAAAIAAVVLAQQPEMAHLHMTGMAGELSLDFATHDPTVNCTGGGVQFGTDPSKFTTFVPSYSCEDFTSQEMIPTFLQRALLTGLVTGTKYYYVTGSEASNRPWSRVYSFVYDSGAAREGGRMYAVLADFGFYNDESLGQLMEEAMAGTFDVLLHAGDFAYDLDTMKGLVGDEYMRSIEPIVSSMPYMGIPGNHEDALNFTQYKARFASVADHAGANSDSGTNMYYSFNDGLTHFVMWDSEAFWAQPEDSRTAMMNWLAADLQAANANRTAVPWIIALAHKAWYMDDTLNTPTGEGAPVWKLLNEAGVDFFLCGHVHEYQRTLPFYPNANNGTGVVDNNSHKDFGNATHPASVYTDPAYMVQITTAAPGDQEVNAANPKVKAVMDKARQLTGDNAITAEYVVQALLDGRKGHSHASAAKASGLSSGAPDGGVVATTNNYGFSLMQIVNRTHLHWTFSTAVPHVNSTNPDFSDELWLVVNNHGPRNNLPPV